MTKPSPPSRDSPSPALSEPDVLALVRRAADEAGGVTRLAHRWKLSPAYVCDVLNGRRGPGPSVLKALGLERVRTVTVVYRAKIGG